ncbi:MAG: glucosamine-6-phosphate deaminase [Chloroflexi bacterium]|nr:MAG: glucosamine-6-phosphate deaminase [Chloroflexota bacterium]
MRVMRVNDYGALSQAAADWVVAQITARPDAAAVFPTGNTPIGLYQELARRYTLGLFSTTQLRLFLLDEYWGLADDDPRSFYMWLTRELLNPLSISPRQLTRLPSHATDPEAAGCAFDAAITAAGGLDFAVLGLGLNGHLGYNEPPAAADAPTRVLTLTESSIESAAGYFGGRDRVPRQAIALGMAPLLAARHILLIASGEQKRDILRRALKGPVTPEVPASFLQQAPAVTVIADTAAWPEGDA